jgi:unsaturated chondroitin disaccharide hydrolase
MKKSIVFLGLSLALFHISCKPDKSVLNADKYLDFALQQVNEALKAQHDVSRMPRTIGMGEQAWGTTGLTGWTSGFWPGILWYMYEYSGDAHLFNEAQRWTMPLKTLKDWKPKNHDLGFMVFCSFGNGYRLTGNPEYKDHILEMADSLAALFNPNAGTILSWPGRKRDGFTHNTIIDNMMNLELLFWASKNGGNRDLYDIAVKHARTTMRDHVRPDYSSYHVVFYDSLAGSVKLQVTHQGYSDESMWARGQAWGIYGFAMAYRETGLGEFLETAKKMAHMFVNRLPEDHVPYWDFDAPNIPKEERDASAAAIAASALLELSTLVDDREEQSWYRKKANHILRSLSENYLSDGSNHAVLWHSVGNKNSNSEVDVPIIYADYYYIEALIREKKLRKK